MASNKKIFDVSQLDLESYALSLGLAHAPTVRFVQKGKRQVTADPKAADVDKSNKDKDSSRNSVDDNSSLESDSGSCSDDSDDDNSSTDGSIPRSSNDNGMPMSLNNIPDDDDDILIKKASPSTKTLLPKSSPSLKLLSEKGCKADAKVSKDKASKLKETKYAAAKKILKKKLVVNSKIVFDDEGVPVGDAYKQPHTFTTTADNEGNEIGGIDISEAKNRLKHEDLFDKQLYRDKIKQKHREKRLKEKLKRKKKRQPDGEVDREDGDVDDEPNLDFLPDPDKIYGPEIESDEDNQERLGKQFHAKEAKDNADSDDSFNSCDYDDAGATTRKLKTKKKTKKRKLAIDDSRTSAKRSRSSRDIQSDSADDYDTGRSLMDDEALALKLLNS